VTRTSDRLREKRGRYLRTARKSKAVVNAFAAKHNNRRHMRYLRTARKSKAVVNAFAAKHNNRRHMRSAVCTQVGLDVCSTRELPCVLHGGLPRHFRCDQCMHHASTCRAHSTSCTCTCHARH